MGDTISPPKALARTLAHIQKDEAGLKRCVTGPVNQAEYDELVDNAYQYGVQATCASTMVREINAGNYVAACHGYTEYRYLTSASPTEGWEAYKFDATGRPDSLAF
jgi:lysozyme